jgi:geranylgeranyl diphosphate synthase, type II
MKEIIPDDASGMIYNTSYMNPTPASEVLDKYKTLVSKEISSYLSDPTYPTIFQIPRNYKNNEHKKYWEIVRNYPERKGKYIRPSLTLLTCEAMHRGKKDALKTSAAMQLSEDWILLDDDIMDNSLLRRGKPTLHRLYGIAQAINASDTLQAITWKILSDNYKNLGSTKTKAISDELFKIVVRTLEGQSTETQWTEQKRFDISEEDYFFVVDGKTSYYSIAGPMRLGAIVAGASEQQMEALAKFGMYLGRAFQLVDDILGVTSDFGKLKQQAGDIYEGKTTLLVSHLLGKTKGSDRKKILSIIQKPFDRKTKDEVSWVVEKMREHGSIQYAQILAEEYKKKASHFFDKDLQFLSKEPARKNIKLLMEFILNRSH